MRIKSFETLVRSENRARLFLNDAISKAYFAIHAISRAILILHDIRASTHEGVKAMFLKELIKEARILPRDFAKKYSQQSTPLTLYLCLLPIRRRN